MMQTNAVPMSPALIQAQSLANQGNLAAAMEVLSRINLKALKLPEKSLVVRIAAAAGHANVALEVLNSLLGQVGEQPELLAQKADLLHRLGRSSEAIKLYEALAKRSPSAADWLYNLALIYFDTQQINDAKKVLKNALSVRSSFNKAQLLLARCDAAEYRFEQAQLGMDKLQKQSNGIAERYRLARLHMFCQRTDEARQLLQEVQRENSRWVPVYLAIATNEVYAGNANEALKALHAGLSI